MLVFRRLRSLFLTRIRNHRKSKERIDDIQILNINHIPVTEFEFIFLVFKQNIFLAQCPARIIFNELSKTFENSFGSKRNVVKEQYNTTCLG